jgi:nitrogen fixation-related uncharacterized protein
VIDFLLNPYGFLVFIGLFLWAALKSRDYDGHRSDSSILEEDVYERDDKFLYEDKN